MKIQLPEKVKVVIQTLEAAGYEAYAVGGCVRDSVLGRIPADLDITTSALPEQVIAANPQSVADYKGGKEKALGFLVGQTMKQMKGKANPGAVNKMLKELL